MSKSILTVRTAIVRGGELLCSEQETEPHRHDKSCYEEANIQTEQTSDGSEESGRLICGLEETNGHIHDESCVCPGGELICGLSDEAGRDYDQTGENEDIEVESGEKSSKDTDKEITNKGAAENEAADEADSLVKTAEEASDKAVLLLRLAEMVKKLPQISDIDNISEAQAEELLEQLNRISDFIELHELEPSAEQEKLLSSVADSVNLKLVSTLQDIQTLTVSTSQEFRNAVDTINSSTGDFIIELEDDITISGDIAFKKNIVTINGNGHTISGGSNATIQAKSGAIVNLGKDNLTLDGSVSPSTGPLISVSGGATVNLYDGVAIQNSSRHGSPGGVQVDGKDSCVNMFGGIIENCSNLIAAGGGVLIDNSGSFNISGGKISKCTAKSSGAGVYVKSGTVTMSDGIIDNCTAERNGGGIYVNTGGTLNMSGGTIQNCTASQAYGGGITVYGKADISGGSIDGNKGNFGGGIAVMLISDSKNLRLEGCEINNNETSNYGGGMFLYSSTVGGQIKNCSVEENKASIGGGIFLMSGSSMDFSGDNNTICNNTAKKGAADIFLNASTDKIKLFDAASMGKTFGNSGEPIDGWYTDDPQYLPTENAVSVYNDEIHNGTEINGECALVASYAIYKKATVSYDLDGGIADTGVSYTSEKVSLKSGSADILLKKAPSKAGYTFTGWNDGTNTYRPGDKISIKKDITLKAVWIKNSDNSSSAGSSLSGGSSSGRYSDRESKTAGTWQSISASDKKWNYINADGSIVKNKWVKIENPYAKSGQQAYSWFHFDNNGIMDTGWYLDNESGDWYMLNNISDGTLGSMKTGWYNDPQDNEWYYLDPDTGKMLLGWQFIDSKWYYFNSVSSQKTWDYDGTNWFFKDNTEIKPYGAMYIDEFTPDGFYVDKTGKWN